MPHRRKKYNRSKKRTYRRRYKKSYKKRSSNVRLIKRVMRSELEVKRF